MRCTRACFYTYTTIGAHVILSYTNTRKTVEPYLWNGVAVGAQRCSYWGLRRRRNVHRTLRRDPLTAGRKSDVESKRNTKRGFAFKSSWGSRESDGRSCRYALTVCMPSDLYRIPVESEWVAMVKPVYCYYMTYFVTALDRHFHRRLYTSRRNKRDG